MARAKKHWVQAMLGEDTYSPFPYFYDTTAWSGPRLFNVRGGRSGAILRPESKVAPPVRAPCALPVRLGALRMSARGSSAARPPPPRCGQDRVDVLRVRPGDAAAPPVRRLRSSGLRPQLQRLGSGVVRFVAPTPTAEESPVLPDVVAKLTRLGSDVVAVRVP